MTTSHEQWLASLGCCICERDAQVHHLLRVKGRHMMGKRASRQFAIPLCPDHHRELHGDGNEETFFATHRINAEWLAGALWAASDGDVDTAAMMIMDARYGR